MKNTFLSLILGIAIIAPSAHARTYNGHISKNDLYYYTASVLTDIAALMGANAVTARVGLPNKASYFLKAALFFKTSLDTMYLIDELVNLNKPCYLEEIIKNPLLCPGSRAQSQKVENSKEADAV